MKKVIALTFLLLAFVPRSEAYAAGSITEILNVLIKNNLLHDAYNNDTQIGKKICKMFGGDYMSCINVTSIGKGICYAGGGDYMSCMNVTSISAGINFSTKTAWIEIGHGTSSITVPDR